MPSLVCVKTFNSRIEADIAKGVLEANGIKATLSADDAGGIRPDLAFVIGVKLLVLEEDAEEALELLETSADW